MRLKSSSLLSLVAVPLLFLAGVFILFAIPVAVLSALSAILAHKLPASMGLVNVVKITATASVPFAIWWLLRAKISKAPWELSPLWPFLAGALYMLVVYLNVFIMTVFRSSGAGLFIISFLLQPCIAECVLHAGHKNAARQAAAPEQKDQTGNEAPSNAKA